MQKSDDDEVDDKEACRSGEAYKSRALFVKWKLELSRAYMWKDSAVQRCIE